MFSQAIADAICERLADGESLRKICEDAGFPSESTVRGWALDDKNPFSAQYTHARTLGYHRLSDEILQIADTPQIGSKSVSKATGLEITEGDMIEHRRLQVEARKWMLSKMLPKVYGDKQTIDINDVTPLTHEQVTARIAELMAKAADTGE